MKAYIDVDGEKVPAELYFKIKDSAYIEGYKQALLDVGSMTSRAFSIESIREQIRLKLQEIYDRKS